MKRQSIKNQKSYQKHFGIDFSFFKRTLLVFCITSFFIGNSFAQINIASGWSSATAGRLLPILYAGVDGSSIGVSVSSVGYNNTLSYHSAYQGSFLIHLPIKSNYLLASAGYAIGYYQIGFKKNLNSTEISRSGYSSGPVLRIINKFGGVFIFGIEAMFGISIPYWSNHLTLNTQDTVLFLVGVRF